MASREVMRLPKHSQNILHFLQFSISLSSFIINTGRFIEKRREVSKNSLNPCLLFSPYWPVKTEVDVKLFILFNRRLEKFHPNRFISVFQKKQTVGAGEEAPGKVLFSYS